MRGWQIVRVCECSFVCICMHVYDTREWVTVCARVWAFACCMYVCACDTLTHLHTVCMYVRMYTCACVCVCVCVYVCVCKHVHAFAQNIEKILMYLLSTYFHSFDCLYVATKHVQRWVKVFHTPQWQGIIHVFLQWFLFAACDRCTNFLAVKLFACARKWKRKIARERVKARDSICVYKCVKV